MNLFGFINILFNFLKRFKMITVHFDPGPNKLLLVKALKVTLNIGLKEAKDFVDLHRVQCEKEQGDAVIEAIEGAGGKLT